MLEEDIDTSFKKIDQACQSGQVDIVKEFINMGFDVNKVYQGYQPFNMALTHD